MIEIQNYRAMIAREAWRLARLYGLDFEDIEAQGLLVYCEALRLYDPAKGSFSTYLFSQLCGRLAHYAAKEIKKKQEAVPCEFLENIAGAEPSFEFGEFMEAARLCLDDETCAMLSYLTSYAWHDVGRARPTVTDVMREFGVSRRRAMRLWERGREFWLRYREAC